MGGDWSKYNEELVKRGEMLLDPMSFGLKAEKKRRRTGIINTLMIAGVALG